MATTAASQSTDPSVSKAPILPNGNNHDDALIHVEPPKVEDLQPSYAKNIKGDVDEGEHGWYGAMINSLGAIMGTLGAVPCCIICPNPYRPVEQGSVGLITKFGRFTRAVDPGLVKVNPLSERLISIDVKIQIVGMYFYHQLSVVANDKQRFLNKLA